MDGVEHENSKRGVGNPRQLRRPDIYMILKAPAHVGGITSEGPNSGSKGLVAYSTFVLLSEKMPSFARAILRLEKTFAD